MEKINESGLFHAFVNEAFSKGYYFSRLNYQNFYDILYHFEKIKSECQKTPLAKAVIALPPEKKPLYDRFRIKDNKAYYEFGPMVVKGEDRKDIETNISFDEFIAAAWNNQIRFGISEEAVRQRIDSNFRGMISIAEPTMPVKGEDARLEYLTTIEKDFAPVEDPKTGRLDLKRNKCSFPQILDLKQNRIIRKLKASGGIPGYHLNGKMIPPSIGRDYDLKALAGDGTEVVVDDDIEYLVANSVGYIVVHPRNNKISVTAEAQNHSPIGPETGSLEIKASRFIQHSDILHGYSVRCNSIHVEGGSVNGEIVSERGRIEIHGNVNSGRLIARDGIIRVKGIVTMNAYLESLKGDIILDTVENSAVIGKNITIQTAVNCHIVGENISVGTVQSSKIAGLSVCVENSEASGNKGENTDIIIPILEFTDKRVRVMKHIWEEKKGNLSEFESKTRKLKENKLLLAFLEAVKTGDAQAMNALKRHATPIMNEINKLSKELEAFQEEVAAMERNFLALSSEHDRKVGNLQTIQRCVVENAPRENINLKLYGGLDWPLDLEQIGDGDEATYNNFMALVDSLTKSFSSYKRTGYIQILTEACRYDYFTLLKMYEKAGIIDPFQRKGESIHKSESGMAEHRESRVHVISEEDFKHFMKNRKWLPRKQSVEIVIDEIFKGYVQEFSTSELSMLLEKGQKWRPIFEKGEKLKLATTIFGTELKYDFIVAYINEKADYLKVSGYLINTNSEDVDRLYKIKSRFEVIQKSSDQTSRRQP